MKPRYSRRDFAARVALTGIAAALGEASIAATSARAQQPQAPPPPPATLGLEQGVQEVDTPDFALTLARASQTATALRPKGGTEGGAGAFDFTPADRLAQRASNGFYHLGDLTLRVRAAGVKSALWRDLSTAAERAPVRALPVAHPLLAAADLAPTLPADSPVRVVRTWALGADGRLALRFAVTNATSVPVEIGALGVPMVFNNLLTGRSLEQAHEICTFSDPYIGRDAGYLQVTRLSGAGPALVVVPEAGTPFEAYHLLPEPMRPSQTFEGTFAWVVHSRAFAENEWKSAEPWNPPTSATLAPGETRTYGLRFLLAPRIREIEATLAANGRPVAVGVPGYVLPADVEGKLFLKYGHRVKGVSVEPKGTVDVARAEEKAGWQVYGLRARGGGVGRARLTVTYEDGTAQTVHLYRTKPAKEAVADLGRFLMTRQWFEDPNDPFGRGPSVISYDREADRMVTQDSRVWIAGLGDEGGSGSWLAAAMKLFGQPDREQVARYARFVDTVLWGRLQYAEGPNRYGVRKSLFFYEPAAVPGFAYDAALDWKSWTSWNKKASEDIGRGYNYPHVVAAYWTLYRVARNHPGLVEARPWDWYLEQAYRTTAFMFGRDDRGRRRVGYVELGLMEGTIFLALLDDLKREGWAEKAAEVEALMKERADRWSREAYPFGSEMAWDSTGQEEVYAWCRYFGHEEKARVSLESVVAYTPAVPHWGYHGNSRRYWDFLYGGKLRRIERQLHHYGSGLNAIPTLAEYRRTPADFHLLRIGYGGTLGALTNIDREGFASAAFHSFPSALRWDPYSGDYGPNFFGHAMNAATYLVEHPEWGWLSFGGNVRVDGDRVRVEPRDAFRRRVYLAPRGLYLTLDAGAFEAVELDARTGAVRVALAPAAPHTPVARLRVEQPARLPGVGEYRPEEALTSERGAYTVPLPQRGTTWLRLTATAREGEA